jgi:hypothetical protein
MGMTDVGRRLALDLTIGAGGTHFGAANAYLGVGTSNTAFAASQTALHAGEVREVVDSGGTRATDTITWVASFETGDANIAWAEQGVFNASAAGTMLCRVVTALGTKASGVWTLTYTLAVTNT